MLAMTSMAVTASICANASELALLVASFMPVFSLNLGATNRGAKTRSTVQNFYSEHPATNLRLDLWSPRGEYRLSHRRTVLRRQFDSGVSADGYWFGKNIAFTHDRQQEKVQENHGPYRL